MTTNEDFAAEAHDIGSAWDATVVYLLTGSEEARRSAATAGAEWRQKHPVQLIEMEDA